MTRGSSESFFSRIQFADQETVKLGQL